MHTRLFGMTNLSAAAPWALQGGPGAIEARLNDPFLRAQMRQYESIVTALARGNWDRMTVVNTSVRPELSGLSIGELARRSGRDSQDALLDLLRDEVAALHKVLVLAFVYRAEDTHFAFEHPECLIGSDATARGAGSAIGRLPAARGVHLGRLVLSALRPRHGSAHSARGRPPAHFAAGQALGLGDRGVLAPGAWADIALFDPAGYAELGTLEQPDRPAAGMRHVLVNGHLAWSAGASRVGEPAACCAKETDARSEITNPGRIACNPGAASMSTSLDESVELIRNVRIPMPDGITLAADLHQPRAPGKYPAIIEYTPYHKRNNAAYGPRASRYPYFASHGYVFVNVDIRGLGDSAGFNTSFTSPEEIRDGQEVIRWCARQPWCDGNVGMIGISYTAGVCYDAARLAPPELKAIILCQMCSDWYDQVVCPGGSSRMFMWENYAPLMAAYNLAPPGNDVADPQWDEIWRQRLEQSVPWSITYLQNQLDGPFWRSKLIRGYEHEVPPRRF